ncbi:uncharacterized protein Fot_16664 [Forsythia ovata]|uniref:Uncharacterized protein n=1 Tax=Forsythia ovata TaxID=205694 RepID=A0ABD1VD62_9LAMI
MVLGDLRIGRGDYGIFIIKYAEYIYEKKISEMPNPFDTKVARHNMAVQLYKYALEKPDIQCKQKNRGEENTGEEIEVASETIGGEDEEMVNDIEDETNGMAEEDFIDKLDENLEEIGDFSAESNEEAVWTAELLHGSFMKLQGVNLDYQEMEGKIEEDKAAREGKYNLHETIAGDTSAKAVEYNIQQSTENSSIDKYMVELETQNKATRKIILIGTVSVVSWISCSCSWLFGLSFVKLCLIVFFTMVLSKIQGY